MNSKGKFLNFQKLKIRFKLFNDYFVHYNTLSDDGMMISMYYIW